MAKVDVRVLGELSVAVDSRPVDIGKGNERLLVAALALAGGRPRHAEAIIDLLWPDRAPRTAREMVRIYVRRLRGRLGDTAIETTAAGYALATDDGHVDSLRFEHYAAAAARAMRELDGTAAIAAIDEALALWGGEPFADLDDAPFVRDERARLHELRLNLLEERVDVELAAGAAGQLVAELEALVREHPYRERLRAQLMLALYRAGRQTDALAQFQETRSTLVETFGVEPGRDLQELHRALLRQDPELDLPPRSALRPPLAPLRIAGNRPRRAIAVAAGGVAAAAVLVSLLLTQGAGSHRHALVAGSIATLDAHNGTVRRVARLEDYPTVVASDGMHIWYGDGRRDLVSEVRDDLRTPVRSTRLATFPFRLVVGLGAAWIANGYRGTIVRVDAKTGSAKRIVADPDGLGRVQIALGGGSLWAASQDGAVTQTRADGSSSEVVARHVGRPEALVDAFGDLWIAQATQDTILRLHLGQPQSRHTIPIGGIGESIAVGDGSVWVATPTARTVWRIDPRTNSVVASIPVAGQPTLVAAGRGAVWVGCSAGSIVRIDPKNNRVVETIATHGPVGGLALRGTDLVATVS